MNHFLQLIYDFFANLKIFPVISALVIMAVFAVIAGMAVGITGSMIQSFCKKHGKAELEKKLRRVVKKPTWIIFTLFGFMFVLEWLDLFPRSRPTIQSVLGTIVLLISATTLNKFVSEICNFWRESKERAVETITQFEKGFKWLLGAVCFFLLLAIWNIDLAPLLASAGFAGIVVAVAAKDFLSNLFGGLSLAMDKPFNPGDYVVLESGERGKVVWIGGRSTVILTRDNVQISIPNSMMANTRIKNESAPEPRYRIRLKVGVAYGSDFDQVEEALLEVARDNKKLSKFPEPRVRFRAFADSAIQFELLCWARKPEERGIVTHQLGRAIDQTFKAKNIKIPFPQQDVYLHQQVREGDKNNKE